MEFQSGTFADIFLFIIFVPFFLTIIITSLLTIIGQWKCFNKAGKPAWAALIPVYNSVILIEIADLPMWYLALFFIPFANIYASFKTYIEFAKKFGESTGFAVGMLFLPYIFWPILGSKQYKYIKSNSKFCPNCGTKMNGNANFCINCGCEF